MLWGINLQYKMRFHSSVLGVVSMFLLSFKSSRQYIWLPPIYLTVLWETLGWKIVVEPKSPIEFPWWKVTDVVFQVFQGLVWRHLIQQRDAKKISISNILGFWLQFRILFLTFKALYAWLLWVECCWFSLPVKWGQWGLVKLPRERWFLVVAPNPWNTVPSLISGQISNNSGFT